MKPILSSDAEELAQLMVSMTTSQSTWDIGVQIAANGKFVSEDTFWGS